MDEGEWRRCGEGREERPMPSQSRKKVRRPVEAALVATDSQFRKKKLAPRSSAKSSKDRRKESSPERRCVSVHDHYCFSARSVLRRGDLECIDIILMVVLVSQVMRFERFLLAFGERRGGGSCRSWRGRGAVERIGRVGGC